MLADPFTKAMAADRLAATIGNRTIRHPSYGRSLDDQREEPHSSQSNQTKEG